MPNQSKTLKMLHDEAIFADLDCRQIETKHMDEAKLSVYGQTFHWY